MTALPVFLDDSRFCSMIPSLPPPSLLPPSLPPPSLLPPSLPPPSLSPRRTSSELAVLSIIAHLGRQLKPACQVQVHRRIAWSLGLSWNECT